MNHITDPGKKARGRLSGFSVAFIILFVLFFAAGFGSLGSFRSTGKAFSYVSGDNNIAVFNLEMTDKQSKLTAVYVNVGNVYTEQNHRQAYQFFGYQARDYGGRGHDRQYLFEKG